MEPDPISFWQHVHGASTHFPIALAISSLVFDAGALLFKKEAWRTVGFWLLMTAAVLAVPAIGSGLWYIYINPSGKQAFANGLSQAAVILHRNTSLWGGGALIVLALMRAFRNDEFKKPALIILLALTFVAVSLIGWTGYQGAYVGRGYDAPPLFGAKKTE